MGTSNRARSRVSWVNCCRAKKDGGLGLVNPLEAMMAMHTKWVLKACEPGESNLKTLIRFRLVNYQPYKGGRWGASLRWFIQKGHQAKFGSGVWKRTAIAWKSIVNDIKVAVPNNYDKWINLDFWWTPGFNMIGPNFSKNRAAQLHNAV